MGRIIRERKEFPVLRMTSMMDMFTIFLVFLLINFSTDPESTMGSSAKLPDSNSNKSQDEKERERTIGISVVKNQNNQIEVMAKYKDEQAGFVYPYSEREANAREKEQLGNLTLFLQKFTKVSKMIVILEGDKNLPYRTLWAVLGSTRDAGNVDQIVMSVVSIE